MSYEGMSDEMLAVVRKDISSSGDFGEVAAHVAAALITRLAAAERERDALRDALQCIADGGEPRPLGKSWFPDLRTSKHDQCTHGVWMYEDCGNCTSGYARAALTANHSAPVVEE